jgi:hypothetical protein
MREPMRFRYSIPGRACWTRRLSRRAASPVRKIVESGACGFPLSTPIIGFPKGAGRRYDTYRQKTGVTALGLDWTVPLEPGTRLQAGRGSGQSRSAAPGGGRQGAGRRHRSDTGGLGEGPLVFNLGHGITPDAPIAHVEAMLKRVREASGADRAVFDGREKVRPIMRIAIWVLVGVAAGAVVLSAAGWASILGQGAAHRFGDRLDGGDALSAAAVRLSCRSRVGTPQAETFKIMERRLLRAIMTPAMIATWYFGLWLAWKGFGFHGRMAAHQDRRGPGPVGHAWLFRWRGAPFCGGSETRSSRHWRVMNEMPAVPCRK